MEAFYADYGVCIVEAVMTMYFCLYAMGDHLRLPLRRLAAYVALLAVAGSGISLGMEMALARVLPFSMDYSMVTLLPWFALGFFALRAATHEPPDKLLFVLFLSVQVLHLCRSATYFFYGLFFPAMTEGPFHWADLAGFGIPSVLLTLLFARLGRSLYQKLRLLGPKVSVRLWLIPLFFVVLYLMQTNLYPVNDFTLANGLRIMIALCAFLTYSQMISAVSNAAKAAKEAEMRAQLAHQLEVQQTRVDEMELHAGEMKRIRHDSRQHLAVLRGLLEKGAVPDALAYLKEYEGGLATAIQPPLCENFVADTLCRRYEALARQAGIAIELSVAMPARPAVAGSDLAVILGNLWENAIAAALDADGTHRFIRLRVQYKEDKLLLRMENGYSGNPQQQDGHFFSTKPGRNGAEGVGIASIRAVAARYGGIADFTYSDNTFTASVLLYPQPGEPKEE